MNNLNSALGSSYGMDCTPASFTLRLGKREIFVTRDFRKRYYRVNPLVECSTGIQRGHLELLMFRRWLVILSKAH